MRSCRVSMPIEKTLDNNKWDIENHNLMMERQSSLSAAQYNRLSFRNPKRKATDRQ